MQPKFELTFPASTPTGNPKELSMIQLATDPTASRMSYRPAQSDEQSKVSTLEVKRARTGHAWPFLSRIATRPERQDDQKTSGDESGS